MIIFGAGLAGLLAAKRLWSYHPTIFEKQKAIPNNHSALLRFRTNEVGEAISLPFKKVNVYKGVLCDDGTSITNTPTIRDFNAYSLKSTGYAIERSILNTNHTIRYIAPDNFIEQLVDRTTVECERDCDLFLRSRNQEIIGRGAPLISTIPMPELMRILEYPFPPRFVTRPIWAVNCLLSNVEVYQTLYVPYGDDEPYRVSITGNRLTIELAFEIPIDGTLDLIDQYLDIIFGSNDIQVLDITTKKQPYGKIVPINEQERQKFILWATDKYNIYSLGRYATWRQILLDDVLKDISVIQRFIEQRTDYQRAIHYHENTGE